MIGKVTGPRTKPGWLFLWFSNPVAVLDGRRPFDTFVPNTREQDYLSKNAVSIRPVRRFLTAGDTRSECVERDNLCHVHFLAR